MDYKGNTVEDYIEFSSNHIKQLTKKMDQKIELKAQEINSQEEQAITGKRTAAMWIDRVVLKCKQGNMDPKFATLQLKQTEKLFKAGLSKLEEDTMESLIGTDHYIYGDYKITRREGTKSVDYSDCEEITIMEQHLKELKGKYKAALEGVSKGVTVTLEDHCFTDADGTILKLPKWKYNKSSIVLTKV